MASVIDRPGARCDDDGGLDESAKHPPSRAVVDDVLFPRLNAHVARVAQTVARDAALTVTPLCVCALSELTDVFVRELARDVRAYANHADRDVIDARDVALRGRKINARATATRSARAT